MWHHVIVSFKEEKIRLQINNRVFVTKNNEFNFDGEIGLFNEVKRAFVNNFSISQK